MLIHSRVVVSISIFLGTGLGCGPPLRSEEPPPCDRGSEEPLPYGRGSESNGRDSDWNGRGSDRNGVRAVERAQGDTSATSKPFAPGVRLDWKTRAVEVDAEVALREGPLELLVCSENTREHESVFVTKARPMHIFQALGLLGLEPGRPVRYDKENDRALPPTGDPIDIRIRFADSADGTLRRPEEFLRQTAGRKRPAALKWVFAGSRTLPDGRFTADDEGTIACVVDFDSALIAVDASHSSDNEVLWLEANPESLPKRGTACTLVFSAVRKPPSGIEVEVDGDGPPGAVPPRQKVGDP